MEGISLFLTRNNFKKLLKVLLGSAGNSVWGIISPSNTKHGGTGNQSDAYLNFFFYQKFEKFIDFHIIPQNRLSHFGM